MVQIDWLYEYIKKRNQTSKCFISNTSSGEIYSVILYLFGLFSRWPRTDRIQKPCLRPFGHLQYDSNDRALGGSLGR